MTEKKKKNYYKLAELIENKNGKHVGPTRLVSSNQGTTFHVDTFLKRNAQKSTEHRPRKPIYLSGSLNSIHMEKS